MKLSFIGFYIGLVALSTVHQLHAQSVDTQAVSDSSKVERIELSIKKAMAAFQVPGVAVAIIKDNEVVLSKGFGVLKHDGSEKVNADTLFGIASNTKAMTAALLAGLVDEGKLTWQTKVIDIIPEFQLPNAYVTREFTIIDLLSHNSGLGLGAGDLMIWPETTLTNQDIIKGLKYLPQVSSFRSEFAYDNLMYVIAGEIIKKLTGQPWQEVIQKRIFDPLGMKNTRAKFSLIAKNNKNVARAHVPLNDELQVVGGNFLEKFSSAGSVASSVNDMSLWLKAQLNNGQYGVDGDKVLRLFSKEQSQAMWQARTLLPVSEQATEQDKTHFYAYALGWFVKDYHGVKVVRHTGGILGMVSKVVMVPEENLAMVILTNQQSGFAFNALSQQILTEYLELPEKDWVEHYAQLQQEKNINKNEELEKVAANIKKHSSPSLPLTNYAQSYEDNWYGEVSISLLNNDLKMQFANTPALHGTLVHYQHNTFIVRWDDRTLEADAYVNFNLNPDGTIKYVTMKAVSMATDFSFDFHDLKLKPKL
ncbi:MAG: serine hydrolase [Colwellia polaris]|jgi:CubicO group peptidase (beta-lactamase class C family)|uniref:serine hydrolase n=1 Tax=Colwellia polaris TaxID=326537 RepID=UPI000A177D9A|nr:serine hydrolase [Colwellia polaris]|tara:strand:- start:1148 stop:2746 length:1599 start_codon:yes stop_codon:yes gene_type:complete